ncbi:L-type lectin-domain containing receptor kinase IX.1-like [Durio zibethinus]|uniref:non-specific serine/threonine protein kinase n=1 Tax=Durio zibethinus TaxID=66656 RepID=A0A6P5Z9L1_DURZI|nr:L-type lectin-domain containing receptor kinase IX.1-like [Durio zibethinus]
MAARSFYAHHFHGLLYFFNSMVYLFFYQYSSLQALQFNFPDFSGTPNLNVSGDASVKDGLLSLTRSLTGKSFVDSTGRAVYHEELQLWDPVTGKAADFFTHFSFNISMLQPPNGGDGITFLIAPNGSTIPDYSWGGCLALIDNCSDFNTSGLVAVEFDTYQNDWDPNDNHIGININSIRSAANITWNTSIKNGSKAHAWITYDSRTRNLSVFLTYLENPIFYGNSSLSYEVNLSKVLPEWVAVGFSSSTGYRTEIHNILSWEFNSTKLSTGPDNQGDGGGVNIGLVVGCVVGGSFVAVGTIAILLFFWRKKTTQQKKEEGSEQDDSMDHEFEHGTGPKRFSFAEMVRATNNFSEEGKLGEGGFGGVYKGFLSSLNLSIAVKRVSKMSKQGKKEYIAEVKIISKLRHKNLVQLIGWCHEKGEFLLIYEFMPNGSLDSHLFGAQSPLSWALRYKIALGLASALLYLHEEWEQSVIHRDVKSSNVMLDSNFNARLGDFGLARLMDQEFGIKTTRPAGTFGYMAPEYISKGKASKASDVYSFGVVALEIACGRRSIESKSKKEAEISLLDWVWRSYENGSIVNVADEKLYMDFHLEQMECLMIVGLWCAHPDSTFRPSIRQALQVLNFEAPLPNLPKTMPVPKYDIPATPSSSSSHEPLMSNSLDTTGR